MKAWLRRKNLLFIVSPVRITGIMLILFNSQIAFAYPGTGIKDTIVINKTQSNKKHIIKLYPNATHEVLFFTANGEEDKIYQLFVFDMEGKLVKQTAVRNRQTGLISKLSKGSYVYEVFSNDERIENGNVVIK